MCFRLQIGRAASVIVIRELKNMRCFPVTEDGAAVSATKDGFAHTKDTHVVQGSAVVEGKAVKAAGAHTYRRAHILACFVAGLALGGLVAAGDGEPRRVYNGP